MFSYLHNLRHALKLLVPKYQPLHRYFSTCIQVSPIVHRGLYLYYIYYTFEHIDMPLIIIYYTFEHIDMLLIFIVHVVRIIINSEWYRSARGYASASTYHV